MGNRAVIAFDDTENKEAIYLHWNGGRDSVNAFLLATRILMPELGDSEKAVSTLKKVIGSFTNFSTGDLKSLDCDNRDNGVFVVDTKTMKIKDRLYKRRAEQNEYELTEATVGLLAKVRAKEEAQ